MPVDIAQLDLKSLRPPRPRHLAWSAVALLAGGLLPVWIAAELAVAPDAAMRVELDGRVVSGRPLAPESVAGLRARFESHGYDLAAIAAGERGVPALFVRELPSDWGRHEDAAARKRTFVKVLLPLILRENGRILADRVRVLELRDASGGDPAALPDTDRAWLDALAKRYRTDPGDWTALLARVDAVPASLALAQGAKESGWGTSRFAKQGNALFGQWTWNAEKGIRPKSQQAGKGDYAVRAFDRLGGSVAAYLLNLNTHDAYRPLRQRRAAQRAAGTSLDGAGLAGGLVRYSQRGQVYVDEVRAMIRRDGFQRYDDARLAAVPTS